MCDACVRSGALIDLAARRNRRPWYKSADLLFPLLVGVVMVVMMTLVFHRVQMQPPLELSSAVAWVTGFFTALTIPAVGASIGTFIVQLVRRRAGYVVENRQLVTLGVIAVVSIAGIITALCVSF